MSRSYNHKSRCKVFWKRFWSTQKRVSYYPPKTEEFLGFSCGSLVYNVISYRDVPDWAMYGECSTPSWWIRIMMNVPARREAKFLCNIAKTHLDPDSLIFPHRTKPKEYYW